MKRDNAIATAAVEEELSQMHALLEKVLKSKISVPKLCLGQENIGRFIEINSQRSLAHSSMIQALYHDETNEIFIGDALLRNGFPHFEKTQARRILALAAQCTHAFIAQKNPELHAANINKLIRKKNNERELADVYLAFCQGVADYVSIETCLTSGNANLREEALKRRKEIVDNFDEWTSDPRWRELMASVYNKRTEDVPGILCSYFTRNQGALSFYSHEVGYHFLSEIATHTDLVPFFVENPPTTVRELIYPEEYSSALLKTMSR